MPPTESAHLGRRRVLGGTGVALAAWATPSILTLDRVAAATPSVPWQVVYTEDFQTGIGGANAVWSTTGTDVAPADPGRRFLGQFTEGQSAELTISGLSGHGCLCVEFELMILATWDASHPNPGWGGPDRFNVDIAGQNAFSETFAGPNFNGDPQMNQTFGPAASNPAGTGASEVNTLGFGYWGGDAVYDINLCGIDITTDQVVIRFYGTGLTGLENWGIDNLVVSVG